MFFKTPENSRAVVTTPGAMRHLLVFQVKLLADALRDLVLSPVSVLVFIVDAIRKPPLKDSLYLKLMVWGRKSDRVINLFDEQKNAGHFTVDQAIEEVEQMLKAMKESQGRP
jgi:hypothetical protein